MRRIADQPLYRKIPPPRSYGQVSHRPGNKECFLVPLAARYNREMDGQYGLSTIYRIIRNRWLSCTIAIVAIVPGLIWGIAESVNASGISLDFECQTPPDWPDEVATTGKGGRDPEILHPCTSYSPNYRVGFEQCLWEYLEPTDPKHNVPQLDGYALAAQNDGWMSCERQIERLSEQLGAD